MLASPFLGNSQLGANFDARFQRSYKYRVRVGDLKSAGNHLNHPCRVWGLGFVQSGGSTSGIRGFKGFRVVGLGFRV